MLEITIPAIEKYDEEKNLFIQTKEQTLRLEHSLVSISKWESKWEKPFLINKPKTTEEIIDYVRCMTLTQNVDPEVYNNLTIDNINQIDQYLQSKQTATTIKNDITKNSREIVTSEVIYYWMVALGIPFECQKWYFNRLIMLISVCNIKNGPQKKMSNKEILSRNAEINAARRKALNSKG